MLHRAIGLMGRVLYSDPRDRGPIPARDIPKFQKMILTAASLNTHHYKVRMKGAVEPSRE